MKFGPYLGYLGKVYHIVSHFITIHDQFNDRKTSSSLEKAGVASVVLKGLRSQMGSLLPTASPDAKDGTGARCPGPQPLSGQKTAVFDISFGKFTHQQSLISEIEASPISSEMV